MVKPKYSPEEALKRVKLMMKYDSSKTLNENRTIVEQADISGDIRDLKDEISSFNSDESEIIKIIQKYKSKADFDKLAKAYQEKYNVDFGTSVYQAINSNDPTESKQLQDHLATLGITATAQSTNDGRGTFKWEFSSKETAPTDTTPSTERQKNINKVYCSVKDGKITLPDSAMNGIRWESYVETYKPTDAEITTAKASCKKETNKPKYTPCTPNNYVRGCKSDVVKKVQGCLNMVAKYQTGNFGPITQGELKKLGKGFENGFKDADVEIICGTKNENPYAAYVNAEVEDGGNVKASEAPTQTGGDKAEG